MGGQYNRQDLRDCHRGGRSVLTQGQGPASAPGGSGGNMMRRRGLRCVTDDRAAACGLQKRLPTVWVAPHPGRDRTRRK
jgi:hypothetical protein